MPRKKQKQARPSFEPQETSEGSDFAKAPFKVMNDAERRLYTRLCTSRVLPPFVLDFSDSEELEIVAKLKKYLQFLHLEDYATMDLQASTSLTLEFYTTFKVAKNGTVVCRLGDKWRTIDAALMHHIFGFVATGAEARPKGFNGDSAWFDITGKPKPEGDMLSSFIEDPAVSILHKFISRNVFGKKEAKKLSMKQLFILHCAIHEKPVNCLAFIWASVASIQTSDRFAPSFGILVAALARHFKIPMKEDVVEAKRLLIKDFYVKKDGKCIAEDDSEYEAVHPTLRSLRGMVKEMESRMDSRMDTVVSLLGTLKERDDSTVSLLGTLMERVDSIESTLLTHVAPRTDPSRDKLEALDSLAKEKNNRKSAEKLQASIERVQEDNATGVQKDNSRLQSELQATNETLKSVEKEKAASTRCDLQQVAARDDGGGQLLQVQALLAEVARYKEFIGEMTAELDNLHTKAADLESTRLSQSELIRRLQEQLAVSEEKSKLSALEFRSQLEEQKTINFELQNRLVEGEKLRKKLHNTILELKGNIRVFCRVRPFLSDDGVGNNAKVVSFPTSPETLGRSIDLAHNGQKLSFTFDKVFMPDASQEDVFVEISQLVQSALDGYKVCIFAYGQTGSGKTHTMMGKPGLPDQKGLIPRSLEQVFETRQIRQAQGWKYDMRVSMLEIYNETIRDLLAPNRTCSDASRAENAGKQYAIKHDANGNTQVSDLTIVDVQSSKEVSYLLERAAQSRTPTNKCKVSLI